jgi:hypothetical protein
VNESDAVYRVSIKFPDSQLWKRTAAQASHQYKCQ